MSEDQDMAIAVLKEKAFVKKGDYVLFVGERVAGNSRQPQLRIVQIDQSFCVVESQYFYLFFCFELIKSPLLFWCYVFSFVVRGKWILIQKRIIMRFWG